MPNDTKKTMASVRHSLRVGCMESVLFSSLVVIGANRMHLFRPCFDARQRRERPDWKTRSIPLEERMNKMNIAVALAAIAAFAGAAHAQPKPDTLVLESPPSKTTSERHKGAFAEGASLSLGAVLKPLDPSPVKNVRLDTTHKIIEIAPGVK